jgi:Sigma-70 region 2
VVGDSTFERFVGDSLPALARYAYALTGNVHAGEDLVQDTLVKLAGAWRRVRHDGNPLAYARAIMFRTYVSRWRSLRRRPVLEAWADTPAEGDQYAERLAGAPAHVTATTRGLINTTLQESGPRRLGTPRLLKSCDDLGLEDPQLAGSGQGLHPVAGTELLQRPLEVGLDRVAGEPQSDGDLRVGLAHRDVAENLVFAAARSSEACAIGRPRETANGSPGSRSAIRNRTPTRTDTMPGCSSTYSPVMLCIASL